jgi:hypothetical protein
LLWSRGSPTIALITVAASAGHWSATPQGAPYTALPTTGRLGAQTAQRAGTHGMSRKDESWQIIGAEDPSISASLWARLAVAAAHIGYRTDLME